MPHFLYIVGQLAEGIDVYMYSILQCHGWGITSSRNPVTYFDGILIANIYYAKSNFTLTKLHTELMYYWQLCIYD